MSHQELLRAKALEICERCADADLPVPSYSIKTDYQVNFVWHLEGKHTLALYYKSSPQRWTLLPNTDWLKNVVLPVIAPLCEQVGQAPIKAPSSAPPGSSLPAPASLPVEQIQAYFAEALSCLSLLAPFTSDNVDCSILCQRTREALRHILADPACSHLDQAALNAAITIPDSVNFYTAKEYLTRCLTLCNINALKN